MKSMDVSQTTNDSAPTEEPLPLELHLLHWPLVQSGWKGIAFLGVLLAVVLLIHNYAQQPGMAPIAVIVVLVVTVWFWLPVRYTIRASGIERHVLTRRQHIAWANIADYQALREGVKLRPTWSNSGSLYISWNGQRHAFERMLIAHISRARKSSGSSVSRKSSRILSRRKAT
ncbi:MAG: hypothetical protein KDB27_27280 [Planctomycetales bacterium]|nr:hypothetical protein [Planctomycetales bacterium]